ncbi:MAG: hypothetical protein ACJAZO_004165 [Myxococcota bacterium]
MAGCSLENGYLTDIREQNFTEIFDIAGAETDIVFFADNSSSMQRELVKLSQTFESFLTHINDANPRWRIITVTGDDGCSTSGVLAQDTPNVIDLFGQGIQTSPQDTSSDEWGLFMVRQAVLKSAPGLCNEGFMRPNANLHVVFLSDEPDTSPGWEAGGRYWQDYVTAITVAKGDAEKVRFSAIVGPSNGSCQDAEPGLGYIDAVNASGGEVLSICSDWTDDIEILADASIQQDTFPLQHEPFVETIGIRVNSEDRLEGWTYDLDSNSVIITEDIPSGRDEVVVSYRGYLTVEVEAGADE